ncbi:MAG: sulfotransferase [Actinomycetota bacterium]
MLPSFFVIGAQKAGTTSLYHYLRSHPQIFLTDTKELNFFIEERNWGRGLDWYADQFAAAKPGQISGEVNPEYTAFPAFDGVAGRIAATCPDARLIYLVRHPIQRMRSSYRHALSYNEEYRAIDSAFAHNLGLLVRSLYAMQLERYLQHFPRERILIVTTESLRDRRNETLATILAFLGADPEVPLGGLEQTYNRSDQRRVPRAWLSVAGRSARRRAFLAPYRRRSPARLEWLWTRQPRGRETDLSPETEAWLRRRLRPDLVRLRELMGKDFDAWGLLD